MIIAYVVVILLSCNQKPHQILSNKNLISKYFEINIERDTTLVTEEGLKFVIPKGAIFASSKICRIEVKAALKLADILKAGLTTTSDRKLLSSDGMFYFNVVDDEVAKIVKPIKVEIPIQNYSPNMALFKGVDNLGKLDWTQPTPLTPSLSSSRIANGQRIYMANCANCHKISSDYTGPGLSNSVNDADREYFYEWVRNPLSNFYIGNSDSAKIKNAFRAACLKKKWRPILMSTFSSLSDSSIEDIRSYIKTQVNEAESNSIADSISMCYDSCLSAFRNQVLSFNYFSQTANNNDTFNNNVAFNSINNKDLVSKYQVSISSFGWYNLDYFLHLENNCTPTEIKISKLSKLDKNYHVYFIMTKLKVVSELVLNYDNGKLSFYDDSLILLPQGQQAKLLIYTENVDGTVTYGIKSLNIQKQNIVKVDLLKKSSNEFLETLNHILVSSNKQDTMKFNALNSSDSKSKFDMKSNAPCCPCDLLDSTIK